MNIPQEMSLRTIDGEVRLCAQPVEEIRNLYCGTQELRKAEITQKNPFVCKTDGGCLDIFLRIRPQSDLKLSLFGLTLEYKPESSELVCLDKTAPVKLMDGVLELRMVIDTVYAEIFASQGSAFMGMHYIQDSNLNRLRIEAPDAQLKQLSVSRLGQFWG